VLSSLQLSPQLLLNELDVPAKLPFMVALCRQRTDPALEPLAVGRRRR